jgi:hypothetical protein
MPRGRPSSSDNATLAMALVGYEIERQKIEDKIRQIRARLGARRGRPPGAANAATPAGGRRTLSASARRRIAAAQRKRWAAHRKKMAQAKGKK